MKIRSFVIPTTGASPSFIRGHRVAGLTLRHLPVRAAATLLALASAKSARRRGGARGTAVTSRGAYNRHAH